MIERSNAAGLMPNTPKYQPLAIKFGLIPLVAGISCLLLWLPTRAEVLETIFVLVIMIGTGLVSFGLLFLMVFFFNESKQLQLSRRETWKRTLVALAVLLINFPAAVLCLWIATYYGSQLILIVENDTDHAIVAAEISGGGVRGFHGPLGAPGAPAEPAKWREAGTVLPAIAASESRTFVLMIAHEGSLHFDVDGEGESEPIVIEGYVMHGDGGKYTVTIHADGSASL